MTSAEVTRELEAWPAGSPAPPRFGLEAIRAALSPGTAAPDPQGVRPVVAAGLTRVTS